MSSKWQSVSLKDTFLRIQSGYWGEEYPTGERPNMVRVIRNADVTRDGRRKSFAVRALSDKECEKSALCVGDIALATSGEVGKAWLVDEDGYHVTNFLKRLTVNPSVAEPGFIRSLFDWESLKRDMAAHTGGSAIQNLRRSFFESTWVTLPPLAEQRRIVDLLGAIDSHIDSLRTQVEATRVARSALLAELLSNASGDWKFARLGDVSTLQIGRTPPRSEPKYWSTNLERPFCTIADMNGRYCRPVKEGVTELAEQEGKAKRISAGTLLMSFKLTIGRVAFADCDLFPNEAIVSILPDHRVVTAEFLYYFLGSQDLTRESGQAVKGKTLNGASLRSIEVILPSVEKQREIVNLMDAVERQIEAVDSQIDVTLKLRSGLMSELLSGERLLDESYDVAVSL